MHRVRVITVGVHLFLRVCVQVPTRRSSDSSPVRAGEFFHSARILPDIHYFQQSKLADAPVHSCPVKPGMNLAVANAGAHSH